MNVLRRRGAALAVALVTLLAVMLIASTVVRSLLVAHRQARLQQNELQAEWLAEAAVSRAKAQLVANSQYSGENWIASTDTTAAGQATGKAEIQVQRIDSPPNRVLITVAAYFPDHPTRRARARREYTLTIAPPVPATDGRPLENSP
jgi:type II secretory pathway component PulK